MNKIIIFVSTLITLNPVIASQKYPVEKAKDLRNSALNALVETACANAALKTYKTDYKYDGPLSEKSLEEKVSTLEKTKQKNKELAQEMEVIKKEAAGTKDEQAVLKQAEILAIFKGLSEVPAENFFVSKI